MSSVFYISKTLMSSVFYIFKDFNVFSLLLLHDFNVFCLLHIQRLQCLKSFTFTRFQCLLSITFYKTSMSSICYIYETSMPLVFYIYETSMSLVFYVFKDFHVFSLLHFQRLQCLQLCFTRLRRLLLDAFDTSMSMSIFFSSFTSFVFFGVWSNSKIAQIKLVSLSLLTFSFSIKDK